MVNGCLLINMLLNLSKTYNATVNGFRNQLITGGPHLVCYIYIQLYSHPGKNRASNVQKKQNSILWLLEDDYTIERRMSIIYHIAIYIYIIHGRLGYPI